MPRRNLLFLLAVGIFAFICYQKTQTNPYGRILSESIEIIDKLSLENVKPEELFEGAMDGMVGRLDKYSNYIPPSGLKDFEEAIDQQFGGVGMKVSIDPKTRQMTVVTTFVNTPAFAAGVRSGDVILRIGEHSTQGMSANDAVSLIHGKPGDPVNITLLHQDDDKPVDIQLIRAIIQAETVLGVSHNSDGSWNYFLPDTERIGYLRITSFANKTAEDVKHALEWLENNDMQGLILDLRDNPGGLLPIAVDVCDLFIASGTIVSTRGRDGHDLEIWKATGKGPFTKFPIAVLINQYSASASEIVAACLQDHHRATIVGQRTFGKGTVQKIIDLEDHRGALKITMASYWRPSNKNIHRHDNAQVNEEWGVRPDPGLEVVVEGDELTRLHLWQMRRDMSKPADGAFKDKLDENFVDRQLARALEYFKNKE